MNIAQCRKAKQLSQKELAEKIGVTPLTVLRWENGKSSPNTKYLAPLCEVLGVGLTELFGDRQNEPR